MDLNSEPYLEEEDTHMEIRSHQETYWAGVKNATRYFSRIRVKVEKKIINSFLIF